LGALLAKSGLKDYGSAFEAFENLRKRRAWMVQAYSRASERAIKFAGEAATRRDASWPWLPQRIEWIHRYRGEEIVPLPSRPLTAAVRAQPCQVMEVAVADVLAERAHDAPGVVMGPSRYSD
jgi:hypothetical protein